MAPERLTSRSSSACTPIAYNAALNAGQTAATTIVNGKAPRWTFSKWHALVKMTVHDQGRLQDVQMPMEPVQYFGVDALVMVRPLIHDEFPPQKGAAGLQIAGV